MDENHELEPSAWCPHCAPVPAGGTDYAFYHLPSCPYTETAQVVSGSEQARFTTWCVLTARGLNAAAA